MINKAKNILMLTLAAIACCFAISGENYLADPSNSALSYLRMPASAQIAGVGGAISALGNDPAAVLVNPGLIARATSTNFTLSAEKLSLDRSHYFAGVLHPITSRVMAIGIGWVQYGVDKIERRDDFGALLGDFGDVENTIMLWYGGAIIPKLLAGLSVRYHMHTLDEKSASGFSGDVGLFFQPIEMLNLGLVGHNLGTKLKWDTGQEDKVAPGVRFGAAIKPMEGLLAVSSDLEWTPGNKPQGYGGVEVRPISQVCLRVGTQAPNPIQGSCGVGIRHKAASVDYSFTYHQSGLGHSHLFSLAFKIKK